MSLSDELQSFLTRIEGIIQDDNRFSIPNSTYLYHYTSADGLLGIITNNCIHLSNIQFLNDPEEIQYSIQLFKDICVSTTHDNDLCKNKLINDYYFSNIINSIMENSDRHFVFSTSLNPDSLNLWNNYGKNDGYSVAFKVEDILQYILNKKLKLYTDTGFLFSNYSIYYGKVIYEEKEQKEILKKYITEFDNIIKLIPVQHADHLIDIEPYFSIAKHFLAATLYNMKKHFHQIEDEFRISIIPDRNYNKILFKNRMGIVSPYIILGGDILPISKVVIGPKIKEEISVKGINILKKNTVNNFEIVQSDITIR